MTSTTYLFTTHHQDWKRNQVKCWMTSEWPACFGGTQFLNRIWDWVMRVGHEYLPLTLTQPRFRQPLALSSFLISDTTLGGLSQCHRFWFLTLLTWKSESPPPPRPTLSGRASNSNPDTESPSRLAVSASPALIDLAMPCLCFAWPKWLNDQPMTNRQ